LDSPDVYGNDRLFVYLRQTGELDNGVAALKHVGHPVIEFAMKDPYDAGVEFFRWEIAVAAACHILGVNAFDQPDVQDSKNRTKARIAEYQETWKLPDVDLTEERDAQRALNDLLAGVETGTYIAVNAYLPRNEETQRALQLFRVALREKTKCAVTVGFGPRFQHSTGQFHKGGPNKGLFIQLVYDAQEDLEIPTQGLTFGTLLRAQALGDYEALKAAGRRAVRIRLEKAADVSSLMKTLL
jgi:transaldolase/glucose-6-phosphate isomerase